MAAWYARRAVPWAVLLADLGLLLGMLLAVHRWHGTAGLLLPFGLAVSAAACGFLFDEDAAQVTAVTPRGGRWAGSVRVTMALLPLAGWVAAVASLPGALRVDVAGWALAGSAAGLLALGISGLSARLGVPRPGGQVASAVVLLVTLPLVVGPMLRWEPVFPSGAFPAWVTALWSGIGAIGVALLVSVLSTAPRGNLIRSSIS